MNLFENLIEAIKFFFLETHTLFNTIILLHWIFISFRERHNIKHIFKKASLILNFNVKMFIALKS